jgi:Zn finger protein HypA/HybF involved in hydrogenase expression
MEVDKQTIESAQFSVICPQCGAASQTAVGDGRSSIQCPKCTGSIDLTTEEAKHARQSAAAKASIRQAMEPD